MTDDESKLYTVAGATAAALALVCVMLAKIEITDEDREDMLIVADGMGNASSELAGVLMRAGRMVRGPMH